MDEKKKTTDYKCLWHKSKSIEKGNEYYKLCINICDGQNIWCDNYLRHIKETHEEKYEQNRQNMDRLTK